MLDMFRGNTTTLGTVHRLSNMYNIYYWNLLEALGRTRRRCEDDIKIVLQIFVGRSAWTGWLWLRIGTSGRTW